MAINLQKGQRISLKKEAPELQRVLCGLGWDVTPSPGGLRSLFVHQPDYDLDASVLCLDEQKHLAHNEDVVYFGNLRHPSGAINHLGDNLTGEGHGDDEQIVVDLTQIPPAVHTLLFVVSIYRCRDRQQDFSQVKNAFVRLEDMLTHQEIARYNLSGADYQGMTAMCIAALQREEDHAWHLAALGEGLAVEGLKDILQLYKA